MSGIYLHVPFCRKACHYCDFAFTTRLATKQNVLDALKKELVFRKDFFCGDEVESLYFGGGTPSILSPEELNDLFDALYSHYKISPSAEVTLETNPEDLTTEKVSSLLKTPVNRFSLGVQSFFDEDLASLGRAHSSGQAERALKTLLDAGATKLSIDLIYATPSMGTQRWAANLQKVLDYHIPHLSAYALTVEDGTALARRIAKGRTPKVKDEDFFEQFNLLASWATANHYDHYELSNFCRHEQIATHNTNYWKGKKYLGLGPSAHSYDGSSRQWNTKNIADYAEGWRRGRAEVTKEVLSKKDRYNEVVLTRLRTKWGIGLGEVRLMFGDSWARRLAERSETWLQNGMLLLNQGEEPKNPTITLSRKGKPFADRVSADLFL